MTSAPASDAGAFASTGSERSPADEGQTTTAAGVFARLTRRVVGTLMWLVIIALSALLVTTVLVPKVFGAQPFTILTGSMRPELPPGTLVMVRPQDADTIKVGDVVTYQLKSGEPEVVTHRVVALGRDDKGGVLLQTKGDANPVADPLWVMPVQLKGTVWYHVPHAGRIGFLASPGQKQTASLVIMAGLVGYAGWMFVGAVRDRGRKEP